MTSLGSSNSTSSNSSAGSLANSMVGQAVGQPGSTFQRLKVEDALTYLDQVKLQFEKKPEVYNQFLDIMKEFKSQSIDTPGVISRVSTLFKGHNDLIEGFNTFLPPGYKIEIQANDMVHYTAPNSSMSTLVNQNMIVKPKTVQQTISSPALVPATLVANSISTQLPLNLSGTNLVKNETQKLEPIVLATIPNSSSFKNLTQPLKLASVTSSLVPVQNQAANLASHPSSTISAANAIVQQISNPQSSQGQAPSSQVEFGHAINYVNKIKARFSNQPEVYKSFLEILHTYQKQQKNMKDGIIPTNFLSESEVYAKVATLFKNQEDLLVEFSQFLPDANGNQNSQADKLEHTDLSQISAIPAQTSTPTATSPTVKTEQIQPATDPTRPVTPGDNASVSSISSNSSQKPIKRGTTSIPINSKKPKLTTAQIQKPASQLTPKPVQHQNLTNKNLTMTKHQPQANLDSIRFGPINEITFFEKLKKALRTPQVYENFLKCLALFNQNIITTSELIKLVEPFLSKFSNLYRWFKDYVENLPFSSSISTEPYPADLSKEKIAIPANNIHLEIDYLACKQYGASYRDISSYPQPISSGQTELCKLVLNSSYVSFPSWSEDSTFVTSRKNQYEDQMFRIEDERFELDVVLETNLCTIKVLENLLSKMNRMKPEELAKLKLDDTLGGESQVIHMKAVQRIYADKSKDFIEGLKQNPQVAVPLVLKRLKAKDEEWREAKKNLEKTWREQVEKNYLKSLDYLATPFKQNDQKYLKTKSMLNEIESIYNERNEAREEANVVVNQALMMNHSDPHMTFKYEDKSVLEDAAALIIHHVKRQTTIQKEDKHKIKQIVYFFLPDLFFVSRGTLSDDESSDKLESDDSSAKKLRSNNGHTASATRHTDTNKRRLTDADAERNKNLPNEYRSPEDLYRLFYVDEHWYLFFRYHQILCERLLKIYKHAQNLSEQEKIEAKTRDQSAAEMLKLRSKLEVAVDEYYPAFLDIVRNLLDGNIDSVQYEDTLREMFGIQAYIAFTFDKVVHNCVRQLQFLVQDEKSCSAKQIFTEEQQSSQSGSKVSHMFYQTVINLETNYQKKIESLLNDQNIYKIITYKNSSRLTIELLDTEKEDGEDDEMGDEIEAPKWSDFVDKHCSMNEIDDQLKAKLVRRPVFLTRNAHILKLRFDVYKMEQSEKKDDAACQKQKNETYFLYRRMALKHAQKCHLKVTKKMYDKFRKHLNKWLKEHKTQADCIDDWLLGEDFKNVRTTILKELTHKKPPYHVLYKYKVELESKNTQEPIPSH